MSSPFLHKTIFLSESCTGDLILYVAIKFNLKVSDIDMAIFGFCQHIALVPVICNKIRRIKLLHVGASSNKAKE
jgi:hypothetical protein